MFISSLITPLILLVLYSTFLKNIYDDSFRGALKSAGASISDSIINGCVGGQLVSSLLAVSCVTVAFCSNLLMIRDKVSGAKRDLTVAPLKSGTMALGYYVATIMSSLIICLVAAGACFFLPCGNRLVYHRDRSFVYNTRHIPVGDVWHGAVVMHKLSAFDRRSGVGGGYHRKLGLWLYMRRLYADIQFRYGA